MKWTTNTEQHAYMKMRQRQNKKACKRNPNELWMKEKLKTTPYRWTQQAYWGYRIFDFWNHHLGIAVEVDGSTHNPTYDKIRDDHNYKRSGILVLRVRNKNEEDAQRALDAIAAAESWNERRELLGLKPVRGADKPNNESGSGSSLPAPVKGRNAGQPKTRTHTVNG